VQGTIPTQGKVQEFSPLRGFGILGRDQFPRKGCRSGETPSMVNGTLGRVQYLCCRIGWGHPLPKSLEHNAGRNPRPSHVIQLWESVDDIPTNTVFVCWSRPWFLPEPWPIVQLFLATWCQSNSRTPFSCT
jgi:hypothetical protein